MHVLQIPACRVNVTVPRELPDHTWSQSIQVYVDDDQQVLDLLLHSPTHLSMIPEGDYRTPKIIDVKKEPENDEPRQSPDHETPEGGAAIEDLFSPLETEQTGPSTGVPEAEYQEGNA